MATATMDLTTYVTKETTAFAERLSAAAAAAMHQEIDRLSDEAQARLTAVETSLARRSRELDDLTARMKALQSQEDATRQELAAEVQRVAASQAELESTRARHAEAERDLREALATVKADAAAAEQQWRSDGEAERQAIRREAESVQEKLRQDAHATQERLRQDAHTAHEKLRQDLQTKIDAAVAAHGRVADQLKTSESQLRAARAQAEAARTELEASRQEAASCDGQLERLLVCFESMAGAPTISELLTACAESLASEFQRVVLFGVRGNKLQGEFQTGFEFADVTDLIVPLGTDSLLSRAVASGCIETVEDEGDGADAPFGGTPTCALALPVAAGGETLGLLYADDGAEGSLDTAAARAVKGRFAELLLRHAGALVMRLTAELRTLAELRGHAARLLNHAEEMYAADAESGLHGPELRARLLENVQCARRLYAQRVAIEGPAAAGLLEDQVLVLLDKRADTTFGKDLAAIAA